jgi:hypothetical protein
MGFGMTISVGFATADYYWKPVVFEPRVGNTFVLPEEDLVIRQGLAEAIANGNVPIVESIFNDSANI